MFKHVIAMAKELGLECIIEGVETNAQVKILRDFGCDKVQGYLFDKPLPIEDFEQRLDMQRYDID
jgi:EAL domain-containing protein (putative c-di-GMP-specific phosphodiesterase class I)